MKLAVSFKVVSHTTGLRSATEKKPVPIGNYYKYSEDGIIGICINKTRKARIADFYITPAELFYQKLHRGLGI